jgi:hypothetical protein
MALLPRDAIRLAQGYLTTEVAMALRPDEPVMFGGDRPIWRMSLWLRLRALEPIAMPGLLDVDVATGGVVPLATDQIRALQDAADACARQCLQRASLETNTQ